MVLIIPNSIISFISAQLTQIVGVLITTGKPTKWRPELDGENGNVNTGSRNRVVSRLSAHFPVLKWHSRPLAKQLYCKISKNWSEVSWLSWLLVARAAPSMTTVLSFEGRNGEVKPKFKIDFFSAILFDWRYVLLCVTLVVKLTSKSLV